MYTLSSQEIFLDVLTNIYLCDFYHAEVSAGCAPRGVSAWFALGGKFPAAAVGPLPVR